VHLMMTAAEDTSGATSLMYEPSWTMIRVPRRSPRRSHFPSPSISRCRHNESLPYDLRTSNSSVGGFRGGGMVAVDHSRTKLGSKVSTEANWTDFGREGIDFCLSYTWERGVRPSKLVQ